MTKGLVKKETIQLDFDPETVALIKNTIAMDATDNELKLFLYQAKRTGLDPLARQIYFIKRGGKVVIQTSIDGFRIVAERAGDYAGQDEPEFLTDQGGVLQCAKIKIYKWHKDQRYVAATGVAYWSEYCPQPGQDFMWKKMPRTMLAKVAEALALRKAFPQDLSGLYTDEEMAQADTSGKTTAQAPTPQQPAPVKVLATEAQVKTVFLLTSKLGYEGEKAKDLIKTHFKLTSFTELSKAQASTLIDQLMKKVNAKTPVAPEPAPVEGEVVTDESIDLDEVDKGIEAMREEKAKEDADPDWIKNGDKPKEEQAS